MRVKMIIIVLFLGACYNYAQDINETLIKEYVDSVSNGVNIPLETLASQLTRSKWSDREKVYAIYYWLASNIEYDYEGLKTDFWKHYPSDYKIAKDTYLKRKGVCSGYSHLFNLMCNEIGIESKVIDGYSRTEPSQAGISIEESNHTWNIVKINSKWELVDVTWANSTGIGGNINDYYFLTPPKEFIANHLPEDEEWELLKNPIDKDEFDVYPYISSDYFELGFDKDYPKNGFFRSDNGVFEINIGVPDNYSLLVKIFDYQNNKWITSGYSTDKKCDNKTLINIELEYKGQYLVKVSALNQGQSTYKVIDGILYYTLVYE